METVPLVSVVMPSYNRPYSLKHRSLPSVLRQTYPHWECLVVGDGPEDSSLREAVESMRDPRIKYSEIMRPAYGGMTRDMFWRVAGGAARNHALDLSRGSIICPLDDDDEFLPNHLEDAVKALRSCAYDIVYGPVLLRDLETGRETVDSVPHTVGDKNIIYHSSVAFSNRMSHFRYPLDGEEPDDFGLWKQMHFSGARFGRLSKLQSINYGESRSTRYRLSVPSLPDLNSTFGESIEDILQSGWISNSGSYCRNFETTIGAYVGAPVVSTPSGDIALILTFAALRERMPLSRRKVIVPSYTHPSTANSLLWNGFEPVFCDVDKDTLCITPQIASPMLGSSVAAVLCVYAHGNPYDAGAMERLLSGTGIALIGDASAAFGATIANRRAGSYGDMEILSFSGTKVLTTGEGGAVCCGNPEYEEVVRRIGLYGITRNYDCYSKGINAKLAEIPAALGLANFEHFADWQKLRRDAALRYREHLSGMETYRLQRSSPQSVSSDKDFAIICPSASAAQALANCLDAYWIDTRPYYRPLHRMRAFAACKTGDLTNTDRIADAVVCIPLYNFIRKELVDMISGIILDHVARQHCDRAKASVAETVRRIA
jgi:dTDP-4-amino-4,6-dideoxygalactose transaminase